MIHLIALKACTSNTRIIFFLHCHKDKKININKLRNIYTIHMFVCIWFQFSFLSFKELPNYIRSVWKVERDDVAANCFGKNKLYRFIDGNAEIRFERNVPMENRVNHREKRLGKRASYVRTFTLYPYGAHGDLYTDFIRKQRGISRLYWMARTHAEITPAETLVARADPTYVHKFALQGLSRW